MRFAHILVLLAAISLTLALALALAQPPALPARAATSPGPESDPLLQAGDLTYAGAFRLPRQGASERQSFSYGGSALAVDTAHNALFLAGHAWYQLVAEVTIPALGNGPALSDYPRAALRQPFVEIFDGKREAVGGGSHVLGGMLVWGGDLLVSDYLYYDASNSQVRSHFRTSASWDTRAGTQGPYQVGAVAGFVSGYMAPIPARWQEALGGPALTGNCCLSIISRTSYGPSASVFDPADAGARSPVPATMVVGYPATHATLGECGGTSRMFNCTTAISGVVFPDGTRSVLFFGRQGTGTFCYGEGRKADDGVACFDPADGGKGSHAYPYVYQVWAYDALDLAAVKRGERAPWTVRPYATWNFDLPFAHDARQIMGAAYDPTTRRIYVSAAYGDGSAPLIHAFAVSG